MTAARRLAITVPSRDAMVRDGIPPEVTAYYVERAKGLRAEVFAHTFRRARQALARAWTARGVMRRVAPAAPPRAESYR